MTHFNGCVNSLFDLGNSALKKLVTKNIGVLLPELRLPVTKRKLFTLPACFLGRLLVWCGSGVSVDRWVRTTAQTTMQGGSQAAPISATPREATSF